MAAEILDFKSPWTLRTVPEAVTAIVAARTHDGRHSAAAVVYSADWVIIRTPQGFGRFRPEIWRRG